MHTLHTDPALRLPVTKFTGFTGLPKKFFFSPIWKLFQPPGKLGKTGNTDLIINKRRPNTGVFPAKKRPGVEALSRSSLPGAATCRREITRCARWRNAGLSFFTPFFDFLRGERQRARLADSQTRARSDVFGTTQSHRRL